ncbi:DUF6230 family protein [Antrihabitans stalactiti]|uniref:Cholesterol esterase n=1 Tax=Antrihabitans stalactiti TaxID=2584121 RepID=A0A848KCQ2_9NOCA|nr:DUF6230 family protein [Antrihabitans stalactiti]NMN96625.1 hypothetical protein [Antrihabitans stalactiti]
MRAVTRGGTSWRRTGILLLPALLGVLIVGALAIRGKMTLNLAITGQEFKVAANDLVAPKGLTIYPTGQQMKNEGETVPVVLATVPEAELADGMCISLRLTFPLIGTNTLRMRTTGDTKATNLTASARSMDVDEINITDLVAPMIVGQDASSLKGTEGGQPGAFGVEAQARGTVGSMRGTAVGAVIAGTLSISGIKVPDLSHGNGPDQECY